MVATNQRKAEAIEILAEIDGHLLADIRAMRHWATLKVDSPTGLGRLNFALMAVALIGCERLGFLAGRQRKSTKPEFGNRDPGGYIIEFINGFFPSRHRFKLIAKILADAMRHELVHGFGSRDTTAPLELGLYVSSDSAKLYELRPDDKRPILAINAVAFADMVLTAFAGLKKRVERELDLVNAIVANAAVPFHTYRVSWQSGIAGC